MLETIIDPIEAIAPRDHLARPQSCPMSAATRSKLVKAAALHLTPTPPLPQRAMLTSELEVRKGISEVAEACAGKLHCEEDDTPAAGEAASQRHAAL